MALPLPSAFCPRFVRDGQRADSRRKDRLPRARAGVIRIRIRIPDPTKKDLASSKIGVLSDRKKLIPTIRAARQERRATFPDEN